MNRDHVNRRSLLAGAVAAGVSAPLAVSLAAEVEDPVLPLFRQWVAARIDWYKHVDGDWDEPEALAAEHRETETYRAIVDTVPTTSAGIAALVCVLWDVIGPSYLIGSEDYLDELQKGEIKLLRSIWCAASGHDGLPPGGRMDGAISLELIGGFDGHV
jgi:hypothetical protein